jgi:hypothetical protein
MDWGSDFISIGTCDGSCGSPLHKHFLVFMFENNLCFHCDYEHLVNFSQTNEEDFELLGELALKEGEKEIIVRTLVSQGVSVDIVDPIEVDNYLTEHPELLDHPTGRAQAISKVGLMRSKRLKDAEE